MRSLQRPIAVAIVASLLSSQICAAPRESEFKGVAVENTRSSTISRDGSLIAIGTHTIPQRPSTVLLCETKDSTKLRSFGKHDEEILAVEFAPKADLIAIANDVQRVIVRRVADAEEVANLHLDRFNAHVLRFSVKGDRLLIGGTGGSVNIWNTTTWKLEDDLELGGPSVDHIAISPIGDTLVAVGGNGQLIRWDLNNRNRIGDPLEHNRSITSLDFSSDGKSLLFSTSEGYLFFYDATNWQLISTHFVGFGINTSAFTQNGKSIVLAGPQRVDIIDRTATGIGEPRSILKERLKTSVFSLRRASESSCIIGHTGGGVLIWMNGPAD
jgi:WD40 repeat protein